jgi:hypothetical protein
MTGHSQIRLRYGVKFIGYSAEIVAIHELGETAYAKLDFVSGATFVMADHGVVVAASRVELSAFVASLPLYVDQLKALTASGKTDRKGCQVELVCGEHAVYLDPGADVDAFIEQITSRYRETRKILKKAEKVGAKIERLPYDDYIDEIAKTGNSRVIQYGFAVLMNGKLIFRPERRTLLIRQGQEENTYTVLYDSLTDGEVH